MSVETANKMQVERREEPPRQPVEPRRVITATTALAKYRAEMTAGEWLISVDYAEGQLTFWANGAPFSVLREPVADELRQFIAACNE